MIGGLYPWPRLACNTDPPAPSPRGRFPTSAFIMSLIVDTYNVLHTVGVLPPDIAGVDASGLAELIGRSRYRHQRATLVCDGVPREDAPRGTVGGVVFRYAGADKTADDVIAQIIRRSSSPRRLTVISSDRAVLREARRRRCSTLRSEEFLEHLSEDHEAPKPASGKDASPKPPQSGGDPGRFLPSELLREAESITEYDIAPPTPPRLPVPPSLSESNRASTDERAGGRDMTERDVDAPAPPPQSKPRPSFLPPEFLAEAESLIADEERERAEAEHQRRQLEKARREREAIEAAENDTGEQHTVGPRSDRYRAVLPEELIAGAEELAGIDPDRLDADLHERLAQADEEPASDEPPRNQAHMPDDVLAEAESIWQSGGSDEPLPIRLEPAPESSAPPRPSGESGPSGPGAGVPRPPEPPTPKGDAERGRRSRGTSSDHGEGDSKRTNDRSGQPRRDDDQPSSAKSSRHEIEP
jgi:hypothetical protein